MTQKPFDPLEVSITPEQRGYGRRLLKLNADLSKFEVLKLIQNAKEASSSQVSVQDIS